MNFFIKKYRRKIIIKSDRKIETSLIPGILKAKNPTIKYIKSGIRKQNKLLFFKFLTLRKNKKATIIYSENIMISGLTLIKDINIDCNNSGATPKNKLSLTELFIF